MPVPFALPLAASSTTQHAQTTSSRARFSSLPTRKRKRPSTKSASSSEEEHIPSPSEEEFLAATNPLSLTPAEIAQRKLAGLGLTEPLPSEEVKDFPHRALPAGGLSSREKKSKGKSRASSVSVDSIGEGEDSGEGKEQSPAVKRPEQGPRLRLQHFSVLTTILNRCLQEGDLERASRAWAMLIRVQISGKATELRSTGYWGIGAELLIKSLDGRRKRDSHDDDSNSNSNSGSDAEREERRRTATVKRRWGTEEGLERAKDYYERLILQYPYTRQHDTSVSALDFWPAMLSCEIYGIDIEHSEKLAKIQKDEDEDEDEGDERSGSDSESNPEPEDGDGSRDGGLAPNKRRQTRRLRRRAERRWNARDEIRQTALVASEKLAARLDELMATPPYVDSHNMLKLRANIALYVGDLSVPAQPDEGENKGGSDDESTARDAGKRLVLRQRFMDYEKGVKKQKDEYQRARKLFGRAVKEKGDLEGISEFALGYEEEELHHSED